MRSRTHLTIRPLCLQDQAAARHLILAGLAQRWGQLDPSANPDLDHLYTHYQEAVFLLAWRAAELVGTGALVSERPGVGRIVRMSVAAAHRRQGIGGQILAALLAAARQRHYHQVVLETTSSWEDAVCFYQDHGFCITGEKDGDTHFQLNL